MASLLNDFSIAFGMLSFFALLGGLLSIRWRQPTVVGLLLVGMIIGPNALGIITDSEIIHVFAELGAALLLFSIGLEFSLPKILGSGMRALLVASGIIFTGFFVGYETGVLLGLGTLAAIALAACFSFSSTAIFVRMLTQRNMLSAAPVPLLISVLVIEDIAAVAALAFFSSIESDIAAGISPDLLSLIASLLFSIALMGFIYLVFNKAVGYVVKLLRADNSGEFMLLLALGLCVVLSFLASQIGLTASVGAFLAGSIIAAQPIRNEVEKMVSPFSLAFSSFFFISIGLLVSPTAMLENAPLVISITTLYIVTMFLAVSFFIYLAGFSVRDSILAGSAMAVMGEFSLIVARQAAPLTGSFDLVSISAIAVLLSTIVSSFLFSWRAGIANYLKCCFTPASRSHLDNFRDYITAVIGEFEGKGTFLSRTQETFRAFLKSLTIFVALGLLLVVSRRYFADMSVEFAEFNIHVPTAIFIAALIPIASALLNVLKEFSLLADAISAVFVRIHTGGERTGKRIARDFLFTIPFLALIFAMPLLIEILQLPDAFHFAILLPIAAVAMLSWDAFSSFLSFMQHRVDHDSKKGDTIF